MKYYLIGTNCVKDWKQDKYTNVVELTELDMGALEIACDCIEGYNEECANKIRKVLE